MKILGRAAAAAAAIALLGAGALAQQLAQQPAQRPDIRAATDASRGDALTNPALKGPGVLKFIGVRKGGRVADIVAGRFTTALAAAVGPKGRVYAVMPTEIIRIHPELKAMVEARAKDPAYANVEYSTPAIDAMVLPAGLDAVFIRQNYHDLHVRFMGPADVAAFNRKVFAALKPGGVFVVLDHVAAPGTDPAIATNRLHRIDPAQVKQEVTAAGFVFDGESKILANASDAHDKFVLDPAILGKTDQFLYRFRKPK
ncbi:MAG TPA: methyltransferase [Phenylobacterium sp.]|nr:methyltransferase [Phenylobacterium sp.]